ncbi:hypothetical protein C8R44DRAFT_973485 [Mycena epipterygia]|nr:hypothetical protein C8R44DRAFT_973485 [Mycena epipterygia]
MFGALKLCATVMLLASVVAAVDIEAPETVVSGGMTTIRWTPDSFESLDTFSIELVHPSFNNAIAIANNVNPVTGMVNVVIPSVPAADGYSIEFVNITDINDVFATSPEFSIAPPASTSDSATASTTMAANETAASRSAASASAFSTTPISGSVASMSASASGSGSAKGSAASATASSAARTQNVYGVIGSTAVTCTGIVLLGLLSAAWIL